MLADFNDDILFIYTQHKSLNDDVKALVAIDTTVKWFDTPSALMQYSVPDIVYLKSVWTKVREAIVNDLEAAQ